MDLLLEIILGRFEWYRKYAGGLWARVPRKTGWVEISNANLSDGQLLLYREVAQIEDYRKRNL